MFGTRSNDEEKTISIKDVPRIDYYLLALGVVIICIAFIRFRLFNIPLERDEGEYAYFGKLILDGIAPYTQAYNMKLPGTHAMYALIMEVFGKNIFGIHFGLLVFNSATIVFLFLGFRKIFNSSIGFYTASVFGIMSVSPSVYGFAAHATQFVTFFVSVGIYFIAIFYDNKKLLFAFLSGLMFGLSFLMKQHAVFFIVFGGIAVIIIRLLEKPVRLKSILLEGALYSLAAFLPYLITIFILTLTGAFDSFWFWTGEYAVKYVSDISLKEGIQLFALSFDPIWKEFKFFLIFFFMGIILISFTKFTKLQKLLAVLFAFFAFLTVCPGLLFRPHYFVPFLPAIGLMGAVALDYLSSRLKSVLKIRVLAFVPFAVFFIVAFSAVLKNRYYYLDAKPNEISRMIYGSNPFVESIEISDYIKKNSQPSDKIAVLGSEPQIFFYADRNSATGYIYTYPLMENHDYNIKMQEEMISEIERNKPEIMVFMDIVTSWLPRPGSSELIFKWFEKYSKENYELAGFADLIPGFQTTYSWDNDIKRYGSMRKPGFTGFQLPRILVYKRKH